MVGDQILAPTSRLFDFFELSGKIIDEKKPLSSLYTFFRYRSSDVCFINCKYGH